MYYNVNHTNTIYINVLYHINTTYCNVTNTYKEY